MDIYQFLSDIDPFRKLPPEQRLLVSHSFRDKEFPGGSVLIAQGQPVQEVGILREGLAKVTIVDHAGDELTCGHLQPGDLVFDAAVLSGTVATTGVISLEPTVCLIQPRQVFIDTIDTYPLLKKFFYHNTALGIRWGHLLFGGRYISVTMDESTVVSHPRFIKKALAYIEGNFDKPITLEILAKETAMSKYHFSRQFKQYMGMSFKRYLNLKRVEVAKILIASGDHNVTEAGYAVGFNDASYFTRVFREVDGSPPKSYIVHRGRSLAVEA